MTSSPLTVPALLRHSVAEFGESAYLVTPADRLTYREAEQRSARLARWLLHEGVGKGSRVGLFLPNGAEWVTWWLAVSRIGAVAVPLSTLYTPAEIAKVLRLADIGLLVAPATVLNIDVADRLEAALPELADQSTSRLALRAAPYLRRIALIGTVNRPWASRGCDDAADVVPVDVLAAAEAEVSPADLAIMVHTSGSTADPKGVLHTHGTLVRQTSTWPAAIRAITGASDQSRILCAMPFFWIGGLLAVTGALHEPVTLVVMPKLDPETALDLAERERITGIVGWPAFTQKLREHPSFADRDLSSAPMLRDGPLDIAMTDVPDGFPVHRTMSETAGGFVFTDMAIVDADGDPVSPGDTGELLVRGIGVMAGYNKRERCETFDADGWYHTGDKVYRRDGDPRLFYVGRTTDLIKAAGANVSPLEVEAVIAESADVAQCVVVGTDDPQRGEEVCAVVVPTAALDLAALAAYCREQLSAYKVPTRWALTTSDRIPTLPSGKFDRKALRQLVIDGDLETVRPVSQRW
ncbi:class I adenylate-forming enzyme family protein [Mycolicibacterium sp. 050232]|uniref:class I adenylate-forming enzyme family protein n=1 Tax=Mycolicibacterium sp. 050232 TaxID=3113982 RepID=UPI002E2E1D32|nr:class I adenylate-forming enzyme family protein [Mycolicibacterium sp. 050232]MED5814674.1 class I adenylate-forming enzyme family protein [Mycolicibacterium sp. 050232]